ncbi:MAG: cytochrome P450 [Myxococcota bacterium]
MPRGHWLWGNLPQLAADRSGFLLDGHAKYGDVFSARVFGRQLVFVRDPAVVNAINVTHWEDFHKPAHIKMMWKPFLGDGLVPNDGASWKRQHKLIRPGFHKRRVDAYGERMVRFTRRMVDRWVAGEQRDFREEIVGLALVVVCDTLFDIDIEEGDATSIRNAMVDISEILVRDADKVVPRPSWWPTAEHRRRQRAIKAVEAIIARAVAERRRTGEDRGDLFSHMVFVADEQGQMSDKQLRDEAMTLIFAGHETTAHALTWAWYLLAKNPDKVAKMQEELNRVVGERRIEVDDLTNLPYLEMVIKESLRLLPSVWAYAREPQRDVVLEGYAIKKGTPVTISHIAMGRNERYFDSPMEYRPESWTREFERALPKGAYTPFAQGPRVCLGKQFAMMEMRIVLGTLLQCVEPNLIDGFEPDFVTELSMHPGERGLPMNVRKRERPPTAAE